MTIKAWAWQFDTDPDVFDVLYADTRGKARAKAASMMGCAFTEAVVKRIPQFDGRNPNAVGWLEAGYYVECGRCSANVYPSDDYDLDAEIGEPLCEECTDWQRDGWLP